MRRFRFVNVLGGLLLIALSVGFGAGPLLQARALRHDVVCDCFNKQNMRVVSREEGHSIDPDGTSRTWDVVTWQRDDGTRGTTTVDFEVYQHAATNAPGTLRWWHGKLVAVEVGGVRSWSLPDFWYWLGAWLAVAWLGLGLLLHAAVGRPAENGLMSWHRALSWTCAAVMPCAVAAYTLTYGWPSAVTLVAASVFEVLALVVAGFMLWGGFILDRR